MAGTYRLWSLDGRTLTLVGGGPKTNPLGPSGHRPGRGTSLPQDGRPRGRLGRLRGSATPSSATATSTTRRRSACRRGGLPATCSTPAVQWVELDTSGDFVQGGRIEEPIANPWNGGHSYAFASLAVNSRRRRARRLLGVPVRRLRRRGLRVPRRNRSAEHHPGARHAQGRGRARTTKTRGGRNRWGDYSSAQVDPSDDLSLWTLQEYARVPVGRRRAVRALGRVVGPSRRRAAACAAAVPRAEASSGSR